MQYQVIAPILDRASEMCLILKEQSCWKETLTDKSIQPGLKDGIGLLTDAGHI